MRLQTGGKRLNNNRGQSLVLAVVVMFLLVFIGVVFVLIVARNQGRAGGAKERLAAQYLAEAGINYADQMLRTSEKGADWRPEPAALGFEWDLAHVDPVGTHWRPTADLPNLAANHPDFKWLRPYAPTDTVVGSVPNAMGPTGGYTTFTMGEGRYLVRVTYNPVPSDPTSRYIRIDCVGRIGVVDENDPTTWGNATRLRRELTAYKPIGVTDYLRFATNREKRTVDIPLGAPGFTVRYGSDDADDLRGAPIRVNGNLTWHGDQIDLVLRGSSYPGGYLPLDQVEVSGEIDHATDTVINIYEIIDGGAPSSITALPSSNNGFTTANGFYRDGSDYTDADQHARGVKRLEPPQLEASDPNTRVPRYLVLTRDSGVWIDSSGNQVNTGRYGWGRGVYIDNRDDIQRESETLFGGYTPRADWMKPNNDMASYWQGPYYVPPAVLITLNPFDTDGDGQPDITLTRSDVKTRSSDSQYGKKIYWRDAAGNPLYVYDPGGTPMHLAGSTITIPYPQGMQTIRYENDGNTQSITIERNGVIYADGNIRIRGMLPLRDEDNPLLKNGVQLTIVSGGIIYIEGNLLKARQQDGEPDPTSAIALLAKQYVCVNTTQFMSLLTSTGPGSIGSDSGTGEPPYHLIVTPEPANSFYSTFTLGPPTGGFNDPLRLFVRHAGQYGPSYINMWLNRIPLEIGINNPPLPTTVYGCGDPKYCADGVGLGSLFEHRMWNLSAMGAGALAPAVGAPNYFEVALDQTSYTRSNYMLSSFTVQPLDVRIEAIIYAQDRSFFIIPGNWFNMNSTDTPANATANGGRPRGVIGEWPFFGQPLDIQITLDGAITENLPASVSDVTEWYSKWSNIPTDYGSSGTDTAHPGGGLTFLYDEKLAWPVNGTTPIRMDEYNRPLPVTPCLPVCESLYYTGEPV